MNRRRFLTGMAATVTMGGFVTARVSAEDLPKVSEDDPTAKALGYVHDAAKADATLRKDDSNCSNCQLYQGAEGSQWGACAIFPGKAVAAEGWCKSWVVKA